MTTGKLPKEKMMEITTMKPYSKKDWTNEEKSYAAAITYLDKVIAKILALLEKLDINKNTLVAFTSDNGPKKLDKFESAGKLRGIKRDKYEGGIRVPFIAKWKGKIVLTTISSTPITLWDFMPTACELVGTPSPQTDGFLICRCF